MPALIGTFCRTALSAVGIPLMSNRNLCEPVHCDDGIKIIVKDTCALDSLLQVIMSAIPTNPSYKEATCAIDSKITKLAEKLLMDGKVTTEDRIERARILRNVPIFQKKVAVHTTIGNCKCKLQYCSSCRIHFISELHEISLLRYL